MISRACGSRFFPSDRYMTDMWKSGSMETKKTFSSFSKGPLSHSLRSRQLPFQGRQDALNFSREIPDQVRDDAIVWYRDDGSLRHRKKTKSLSCLIEKYRL